MPRYFLVLNPSSRSFQARHSWPLLFETLDARGVDYDFALTRGDGDAVRLARQAARDGFEVVVAVGGDGTINEVVNGLFDAESRTALAAFGVIYTGTSPDFCGYHGIPLDTVAAVDRDAVIPAKIGARHPARHRCRRRSPAEWGAAPGRSLPNRPSPSGRRNHGSPHLQLLREFWPRCRGCPRRQLRASQEVGRQTRHAAGASARPGFLSAPGSARSDRRPRGGFPR
ncbi:MAG TPA: acylglycerol kinase family protein, partial [Candidatus Ozemobacteraceae bacterium]|nr:acylglycerol kinase family protein [Candidatus Ozemobacteraceae bacterium]